MEEYVKICLPREKMELVAAELDAAIKTYEELVEASKDPEEYKPLIDTKVKLYSSLVSIKIALQK